MKGGKKRILLSGVQCDGTFKFRVGHLCPRSMLSLHESEGWTHVSHHRKIIWFLRSVFTF